MLRYATFFMLLLGSSLQAEWQVDAENSVISFVSFKNGSLAEIHQFRELSGGVSKAGQVQVTIGLDSVDTLIPIRDERMRELLFETDQYPKAVFRARLALRELLEMEQGAGKRLEIPGRLALHGASVRLTLDVQLSRLGEDRFQVVTLRPALLRAGDFDLLAGIEKLREVAGLTDIVSTVPVNFSLQLVRED